MVKAIKAKSRPRLEYALDHHPPGEDSLNLNFVKELEYNYITTSRKPH